MDYMFTFDIISSYPKVSPSFFSYPIPEEVITTYPLSSMKNNDSVGRSVSDSFPSRTLSIDDDTRYG